jgi:glycine cleavage system protein P-like pyridoxal-binding family
MKKTTFKNLIKEALADQLTVVQAQCNNTNGISICDLLGPEKSQKLIDAGEVLRDLSDRPFKPEDIEYMTNVIAVAKREFGESEEVENLESAIKKIMNIDGDIKTAEKLQSLKEDFDKFKLS